MPLKPLETCRAERGLGAIERKIDDFALSADIRLDDAVDMLDRVEARIDTLTQGLWAMGAVIAISVVALAILHVSQNASAPAAVMPASVAPPVPRIVVNVGTGLAGEAAKVEQGTAPELMNPVAGEVGEKLPPEKWVPKDPLLGQKVSPCEPRLGETAINGSCWMWVAEISPPCNLLYRSGNKCYRPVAADPKVPMTDESHK